MNRMRHVPNSPSDEGARRALARRRRRRRMRIGIAWGVLGTLTLGIGLGLTEGSSALLTWGRTHTSLFEVRQVDVVNTRWVSPWMVVDASGVIPGDDIFEVSTDEVAARVARLPRVLRAEVKRTWTRTLRIEVEEKPPVSLWWGENPLEVAADGTLLGPPPPGGAPDWPVPADDNSRVRGVYLPLLTGVPLKGAEAGQVLDDPAAREALEFLARLRVYGDAGENWISEVRATEPQGLVAVTFRGGIPVKIGDGRLSRKKLLALQTVLDRVMEDPSSVEYVDARFRNQVIVKTR